MIAEMRGLRYARFSRLSVPSCRPLPLFLLLLATTLPACKSTRTVLAGPQNPQLDINDYDPQKESASSVAGQQAAAMGMVGSQFGEGKGMSQRFGSADPFGYNRVDKNGNTVMGLNALGEESLWRHLEDQRYEVLQSDPGLPRQTLLKHKGDRAEGILRPELQILAGRPQSQREPDRAGNGAGLS